MDGCERDAGYSSDNATMLASPRAQKIIGDGVAAYHDHCDVCHIGGFIANFNPVKNLSIISNERYEIQSITSFHLSGKDAFLSLKIQLTYQIIIHPPPPP
ncbi:hypothetical protein [Janthinobacterium sp. SUN137]|uniref:hypothetical protein n=1 Tax=Janthinobacterium sp. SUN137 TaxID=3014789 RepID=UPI00271372BB|nr:hypothetical protein [Janthinobacterium sp. SUN137]MDO8042476.1 hypothetical protein [Janthinobacterium sp. SUN137]